MDGLIIKLNQNDIKFDFFQSPINYIPTKEEKELKTFSKETENNKYYQWWSATKENIMTNEHYDTVNESLINLKNKWESSNYDGLFGFSQGSILVQLFVYQIQINKINTYKPKFIILAGSMLPSDISFIDYHITIKQVKAIIISGTKDTLIPLEVSMSIKNHFDDASMLLHSGGHYVSSSTEVIYPLLNILNLIK